MSRSVKISDTILGLFLVVLGGVGIGYSSTFDTESKAISILLDTSVLILLVGFWYIMKLILILLWTWIKSCIYGVQDVIAEEHTLPKLPMLVRVSRVLAWYCFIMTTVLMVSYMSKAPSADAKDYHPPLSTPYKAPFNLTWKDQDTWKDQELYRDVQVYVWMRDSSAKYIEFCAIPALIGIIIALGGVVKSRRRKSEIVKELAQTWMVKAWFPFWLSLVSIAEGVGILLVFFYSYH